MRAVGVVIDSYCQRKRVNERRIARKISRKKLKHERAMQSIYSRSVFAFFFTNKNIFDVHRSLLCCSPSPLCYATPRALSIAKDFTIVK